jgi:hypothetical protein
VFGEFWRTGYSFTNEQTAFSLRYFAQNLVPYLQKILEDLDAWAHSDRKVFWIGEVEEMRTIVPPADRLEVTAEIELPPVRKE